METPEQRVLDRFLLCGLLVFAGCVHTGADRSVAMYAGAGMAGLNNPNRPTGDEDNLSIAAGARIPIESISLRPELHVGDHSLQLTPSVTFDFRIAGEGPGAIDGNVGIGMTFNSAERNHILGNTNSPFLRFGGEGYLVGGVVGGAALMIAPWGYDHDSVAIAGVVYAGVRL